jgi:hypothetical protein
LQRRYSRTGCHSYSHVSDLSTNVVPCQRVGDGSLCPQKAPGPLSFPAQDKAQKGPKLLECRLTNTFHCRVVPLNHSFRRYLLEYMKTGEPNDRGRSPDSAPCVGFLS